MTNTELLPTQDTQNTAEPITNTSSSTKGLWFAIVFLLLLVGAGAGAGYWFFTQYFQPLAAEVDAQQALGEQVMQIDNAQMQLGEALSTNADKRQLAENKLDELQSNLGSIDERIIALDTEIALLGGARASDWLIAEADYLSRMAGRKLWLEDDTRTAIKLLEEADLRLQEAADPALINVRRAIATDIQRIQQINPVSVSSVALSLSGIISTIETLPLNTLELPETESGEPEPVSEDISEWRENLAKVAKSLKEILFTVRRREEQVEPMMSDLQQFIAREQLKLSFMQAQQAALDYNATLYGESLKQATAVIVSHFDLETPQISQLLAALANLQKTKVERNIPEALNSHQLLQDTLSRRTTRNPAQGSEI